MWNAIFILDSHFDAKFASIVSYQILTRFIFYY